MDYVVLDLEWNQASDNRDARSRLLTFEIIEIGAVKLNSRMEIIDTFQELICPQVYEEMHSVTERLIGIHMEELQGKRKFTEVAGDFLKWCGTDFMLKKKIYGGRGRLFEMVRDGFYVWHMGTAGFNGAAA